MKVKDIIEAIGADVSTSNSKMPGSAYGLSTDYCQTGSKLRDIPNSVCASCYAKRLEDLRPSVHQGYIKRTEAVHAAMREVDLFTGSLGATAQAWIDAMVARIPGRAAAKMKKDGDDSGRLYHRWHDSGDLQSPEHLHLIVKVAEALPEVAFWLPTKEPRMVRQYLRRWRRFPANLAVRVSAPMVNGKLNTIPGALACNSHHKGDDYQGFQCEAQKRGGKCGPCRACWNPTIGVVSYPIH